MAHPVAGDQTQQPDNPCEGRSQKNTATSSNMLGAVFVGDGRMELVERPVPRIERGSDVLLKVEACGICGTDLKILTQPQGHPATPGIFLGHEFVGSVHDVGLDVVIPPTGRPRRRRGTRKRTDDDSPGANRRAWRLPLLWWRSLSRMGLANAAADVFELDPTLVRSGSPDPTRLPPATVPHDTSFAAHATAGVSAATQNRRDSPTHVYNGIVVR